MSEKVVEFYEFYFLFLREECYLFMNIRFMYGCSYYMCVCVIDWVIFYGYNQILQYIIDQIIKYIKMVNDFFFILFNDVNKDWYDNFFFKKIYYFKKRCKLNINKLSVCKCDVLDDELCFELCFELYVELCFELDSLDEYDDDVCLDEDDYELCFELDDDVGMGVELFIIEQCCLLNFCCCNGDILIF